jgi:hypothetical protein
MNDAFDKTPSQYSFYKKRAKLIEIISVNQKKNFPKKLIFCIRHIWLNLPAVVML